MRGFRTNQAGGNNPKILTIIDGAYKDETIGWQANASVGSIHINTDNTGYTFESTNWGVQPTVTFRPAVDMSEYKTIIIKVDTNNASYRVEICDENNNLIATVYDNVETSVDVSNISGRLGLRQAYTRFDVFELKLVKA